MSRTFTERLLKWHDDHPRDLPWKEDSDPYKTWVSEIIMQQTRVAQGTPYYLRFIAAFPTIDALANAEETTVLKLWEGLGYYSRARNMHFTAKFIQREYKSIFPNTYEKILGLKGVGPYTAAAIASFSFGLSYPVVDGNVLRVISRYFFIEESIDNTHTKKGITEICKECIKGSDPAVFNQAIMNFGATQCMPRKPICDECYLANTCQTNLLNKVKEIPVRTKKVKQRDRYFMYYVLTSGNEVFIRQRQSDDIWKGLFEFPMIEKNESFESNIKNDVTSFFSNMTTFKIEKESHKLYKQKLSHQTIYAKFIHVEITSEAKLGDKLLKIEKIELSNYSFPKTILNYLKDLSQATLF